MQKWLLNLIVSILADPKVEQMIKNLLGALITERILPLIPVAAASAAKALVDAIPSINAIVDIGHVTDTVRNDLNAIIPDFDLGIPALDNLIDFWRPKP